MSDYPATLGDLADLEARLEPRISRVEKVRTTDSEVTDEKISDLRQTLEVTRHHLSEVDGVVEDLKVRLAQLERLWEVAKDNPELIRELAVQAMKGRQKQ